MVIHKHSFHGEKGKQKFDRIDCDPVEGSSLLPVTIQTLLEWEKKSKVFLCCFNLKSLQQQQQKRGLLIPLDLRSSTFDCSKNENKKQ